jgi:hypothetical protein
MRKISTENCCKSYQKLAIPYISRIFCPVARQFCLTDYVSLCYNGQPGMLKSFTAIWPGGLYQTSLILDAAMRSGTAGFCYISKALASNEFSE